MSLLRPENRPIAAQSCSTSLTLSHWLAWAHDWMWNVPPGILLAGLGCASLDVSTYLADSHLPLAPLLTACGVMLALFCSIALFVAATRQTHPHWLTRLARPLLLPMLLWALWTSSQMAHIVFVSWPRRLTSAQNYGSDDMYYNHYNALLVLHGQNPYVGQRLTGVVGYFHVIAYTPIARGKFATPGRRPTPHQLHLIYLQFAASPETPPPEIDPRTTHSYPAGAFLVAIPFVWAGAPNIAIGQVLALLALWGCLIMAAPARWRLLIALLALTMINGALQVAGGDFEMWALAFTLGGWLMRDHRWGSAALIGLACATKQTAWLAAPLYLVWVWRSYGGKEAAQRTLIALGAFTLINLPWIIASPNAWLTSLFLPISLPLLPDGSGIIALSTSGALPYAPRWVYSALEAFVWLGALGWYWRAWRRFPYAGLALAALPLLFAWRSPERYFELLPLAGLFALAFTLRQAPEASADDAPDYSKLPSLA